MRADGRVGPHQPAACGVGSSNARTGNGCSSHRGFRLLGDEAGSDRRHRGSSDSGAGRTFHADGAPADATAIAIAAGCAAVAGINTGHAAAPGACSTSFAAAREICCRSP